MKTSIKLFLIILTLISVSKAQIIFQQVPNIVDARSAAMGNTEIINSNGSNALYSNPGILATLKTVTIQAGGSAFIGNSSYELADQYLKNHEEKFQLKPKLTHFAVAYPYTLPGSETNITFAAGYFSYYNYSTKKNLE
ncbi:MAG: hypothetical protein K9I69_05180, partial [Ignavibacteriales bacterium]|nr:hypothetical protein [Ignavibacteriales bacterium]